MSELKLSINTYFISSDTNPSLTPLGLCEYGGGRVCEWMGVWGPDSMARLTSVGGSQWHFESWPLSSSSIHAQECSQNVEYLVYIYGVSKSPIRCTVSVWNVHWIDIR